jgi:hypothetical protein
MDPTQSRTAIDSQGHNRFKVEVGSQGHIRKDLLDQRSVLLRVKALLRAEKSLRPVLRQSLLLSLLSSPRWGCVIIAQDEETPQNGVK